MKIQAGMRHDQAGMFAGTHQDSFVVTPAKAGARQSDRVWIIPEGE